MGERSTLLYALRIGVLRVLRNRNRPARRACRVPRPVCELVPLGGHQVRAFFNQPAL